MPARRNRPGKHGTTDETKTVTIPEPSTFSPEVIEFAKKMVALERAKPDDMHYVGWPDMDFAERLAKAGYLREGNARGCFFVTHVFRMKFIYGAEP